MYSLSFLYLVSFKIWNQGKKNTELSSVAGMHTKVKSGYNLGELMSEISKNHTSKTMKRSKFNENCTNNASKLII